MIRVDRKADSLNNLLVLQMRQGNRSLLLHALGSNSVDFKGRLNELG